MNDKELSTRYPGDWNEPTPMEVTKALSIKIIARYGDWAVSNFGDVIQMEEVHFIWSEELATEACDDLILQLSEYDWFTTESYEDFKRALWFACEILRIPYPKQKKTR